MCLSLSPLSFPVYRINEKNESETRNLRYGDSCTLAEQKETNVRLHFFSELEHEFRFLIGAIYQSADAINVSHERAGARALDVTDYNEAPVAIDRS